MMSMDTLGRSWADGTEGDLIVGVGDMCPLTPGPFLQQLEGQSTSHVGHHNPKFCPTISIDEEIREAVKKRQDRK